jgi:hypothetical protein
MTNKNGYVEIQEVMDKIFGNESELIKFSTLKNFDEIYDYCIFLSDKKNFTREELKEYLSDIRNRSEKILSSKSGIKGKLFSKIAAAGLAVIAGMSPMQKTSAANEINADEQISSDKEDSHAIYEITSDEQADEGKDPYKNQSNGSKIVKMIATHGLAFGTGALIWNFLKPRFFPENKSEMSPESLFDIAALQVAVKLELKLYPDEMIKFLRDLNFYVAIVGCGIEYNDQNLLNNLQNLKFENKYLDLITSYALDQKTLDLVVGNMKKVEQIVFYHEQQRDKGQTFLYRLDVLKNNIPKNAKNETAKNLRIAVDDFVKLIKNDEPDIENDKTDNETGIKPEDFRGKIWNLVKALTDYQNNGNFLLDFLKATQDAAGES